MRSKTLISSSKNLQKESLDMIHRRCKNDHFGYKKELSLKKNSSSYKASYKDRQTKQLNESKKMEQFRRKIAPPSLDSNLFKRSLHESSLHFSPGKVTHLPSLKIGSTYKSSFHEKGCQKIIKGKEQDGFFLKMSWHDNPSTNYRNSYDATNRQLSPNQKGKAVQDHLVVIRRPFKGQSVYESCYSSKKNSIHNDSKDCIKSKDHLKGCPCPLGGKSQYKSKFQKTDNKQNLTSSKSIKSIKRLSLFPQIKQSKGRYEKQTIPKKSLKMKSSNNPITGQLKNQGSSTHQRIFGDVIQQN